VPEAVNGASLVARATVLLEDRRIRILLALIGFAAVTLATGLIAHPRMFSSFADYDDEGYMLTALKGFINHGELYDRVFTQYGPFYYEFWGGIFQLFGISVTHDSGRTVAMVVWILSSLILGLTIVRITRSVILGLGTQILSFSVLTVLIGEPMHPVGLIALLLAVIVAIAAFVDEGESPYAMALLGLAAGALVLTKINVGAFAVLSIVFACVLSYPVLRARRWPRLGIEAIFVVIPILLMLSKFGEASVRHYAVHVAVSALAVVIVLRAREPGRRGAGDLRWLVGGFVVLVVLCCVTIVAAGTSLHGLFHGVIKQPLELSSAYSNPLQLASRTYAFDAVGLAAAAAYWFSLRRRGAAPGNVWHAAWSAFAIAVGIVMAFGVAGSGLPFDSSSVVGYQLSMLPFAWVALVATLPGERAVPSFVRLLLPLLAVLQALHAYPVAGSQVGLASLLLVPTGALCVANGVRGLAATVDVEADRLALGGFAVVATLVLTWFAVNTFLREPLHADRAAYHAGVSLDLPGSHQMHLSPEEAELYVAVSNGIRENCAATVMEPGMDSFYLWSGQEPPSYTATGWETLFDQEQQQKVIDDTAPLEDLCLLRNNGIQALWGTREGILTRYLEQGFTPLATWGGYELLRRDGPAATSE
jgi:hypothetical protein